MTKWLVEFTYSGFVEVEAGTEEEAENMADTMLENMSAFDLTEHLEPPEILGAVRQDDP